MALNKKTDDKLKRKETLYFLSAWFFSSQTYCKKENFLIIYELCYPQKQPFSIQQHSGK